MSRLTELLRQARKADKQLGDDLEKYFVDSIKGAGGSLSVFFSRPMGWVIWGLIFASIAWAVYDGRREKKRAAGVCG